MLTIKKHGYLIVVILALVIRLWGLNLNPVGISHDEIHDLINAKSMAITGKGAPGTVAGIFTRNAYCDGNCIFGELGSFVLVPWMKIVDLDIFWSKLPFIIAAVGVVYFGGKLFENMSGKKMVGMITSLLLAINPWAIFFGRTAFENLFSHVFYLGGLYFLTKRKTTLKNDIVGLLMLILGSLAYIGGKPIFPLLVILTGIYRMLVSKEANVKRGVVLVSIGLVVFVGYIFVLYNSPAGKRLDEVGAGKEKIVAEVNDQRHVSLEMGVWRDITVNKVSVNARYYLDRYLNTFSAKEIFYQSDTVFDLFNIPNVGYLYLIDAIMVAIGLITIGRISIKKSYWLLVLIATTPIAAVLSKLGTTYALRAGLFYPLVIGLSATGIWGIIKISSRFRKVTIAGLCLAYVVSFGYFWLMYWNRMPMAKSTAWYFHERALVKYLSLLKERTDQPVVVVVKDPVDVLYLYGFYTKKYNKATFADNLNKNIAKGNYEVDGIKFIKECPITTDEGTIYLYEREKDCVGEPNTLVRISEARDGGARFFMPVDIVCSGINIGKYPYPRKIEEFNIERMSRETFCKTWVSQPI
jgi:hypothetical protein